MAQRIEDYAIIGDMRTAALVGRDGSIDWLCLPRFDSAAVFAGLLGDKLNGRWSIAPLQPVTSVNRRYRDNTLILETQFVTASGAVTLIDFMPPLRDEESIEVVRIVRGDRGEVRMGLEAIFRFDYGRVMPWVRRHDYGVHAIAGPDALVLRTPLALRGEDHTTVSEFTVQAGQTVPCTLTWYPSHRQPAPIQDAATALARTETFWTEWCSHCPTSGDWRDAVVRSLITLKALTYSPTGGMVAAATTSLPEHPGGVRNWDYRYCWMRDSTFTLYALLVSGYHEEARAWREWLLRAVAGDPAQLQIMYGLRGERRLQEFELPWLAGYEASKPVRIGNDAFRQRQLDVYGEVMDSLHSARSRGIEGSNDAWRVQRTLMDFLEGHWQDLDSGLWEARGPERRYTHSAMMTWVAVDRAVKGVERFGLKGPIDRWRGLRKTIHAEICEKGFDAERGCFVQSYGSNALDAALLMIPLVGFLPASDPRVSGTVAAIERHLVMDGFVLRYAGDAADDGQPHGEGTFLACSFWLADNLALAGRYDEARQWFERLLAIRNDVGLLAEEYDPRGKRQLGNFPQAFSHVGLINTAHNLTLARGPAEQRSHP